MTSKEFTSTVLAIVVAVLAMAPGLRAAPDTGIDRATRYAKGLAEMAKPGALRDFPLSFTDGPPQKLPDAQTVEKGAPNQHPAGPSRLRRSLSLGARHIPRRKIAH